MRGIKGKEADLALFSELALRERFALLSRGFLDDHGHVIFFVVVVIVCGLVIWRHDVWRAVA